MNAPEDSREIHACIMSASDITYIRGQLKKLDTSSVARWLPPIVSAVIVGLFSIGGIYLASNVNLDTQMETAIRKALGDQLLRTTVEFVKTIAKVDGLVEEFCVFDDFGRDKELKGELVKLRKLADEVPPGIPTQIIEEIKQYNEFLAVQYVKLQRFPKDATAVQSFCDNKRERRKRLDDMLADWLH